MRPPRLYNAQSETHRCIEAVVNFVCELERVLGVQTIYFLYLALESESPPNCVYQIADLHILHLCVLGVYLHISEWLL